MIDIISKLFKSFHSKEKKYFYNYVNLKNRLIPNTSSEANYLFQDEFFNHKIFTEILFKIRPNISFIEKKNYKYQIQVFQS